MSTNKIGFYEMAKIIFQLSSNMHIISSSGLICTFVSLCLDSFISLYGRHFKPQASSL